MVASFIGGRTANGVAVVPVEVTVMALVPDAEIALVPEAVMALTPDAVMLLVPDAVMLLTPLTLIFCEALATLIAWLALVDETAPMVTALTSWKMPCVPPEVVAESITPVFETKRLVDDATEIALLPLALIELTPEAVIFCEALATLIAWLAFATLIACEALATLIACAALATLIALAPVDV